MHSLPPFDEKALILLIAQGDQQAFTAVFNFYRNRIYTVAYSLTASKLAAEEIVQDVFVKVWRKREELPLVEKLDAWLYVIARNMIFSYLRAEASKNKKQLLFNRTEISLSGSPQEALDKLGEKELRVLLHNALDQLPAQQRQVYLLNREEGMKQQEIADRLKIAPQTVKKHLQYAMRSVRAYILSRGNLELMLLFYWIVS